MGNSSGEASSGQNVEMVVSSKKPLTPHTLYTELFSTRASSEERSGARLPTRNSVFLRLLLGRAAFPPTSFASSSC